MLNLNDLKFPPCGVCGAPSVNWAIDAREVPAESGFRTFEALPDSRRYGCSQHKVKPPLMFLLDGRVIDREGLLNGA